MFKTKVVRNYVNHVLGLPRINIEGEPVHKEMIFTPREVLIKIIGDRMITEGYYKGFYNFTSRNEVRSPNVWERIKSFFSDRVLTKWIVDIDGIREGKEENK
jgi:hypothetical protein